MRIKKRNLVEELFDEYKKALNNVESANEKQQLLNQMHTLILAHYQPMYVQHSLPSQTSFAHTIESAASSE